MWINRERLERTRQRKRANEKESGKVEIEQEN